jgi:hypothetical protein
MRFARIAAVIAIATPIVSGCAANSPVDTGTTQTQAVADQQKWYQAGKRDLQEEKERAALDREGFPEYAP